MERKRVFFTCILISMMMAILMFHIIDTAKDYTDTYLEQKLNEIVENDRP